MRITQLHLKQFRCFSDFSITFEKPIVLIQGNNGTGKTSLLEALHYVCYLRSFRTYSPHELTNFGQENFFIKVHFIDELAQSNEVQVGFSGKKRVVKMNQKPVSSYKELMDYYRIITLTEDDLALIKGDPELRRSFIDQAILLHDADFVATAKEFKTIIDNRNALLKQRHRGSELYTLWTEQLWDCSKKIESQRKKTLSDLEQAVAEFIMKYFEQAYRITFIYKPKKLLYDSYEQFLAHNPFLQEEEQRWGRSLFGAHLDDFTITLEDKKSKTFASRGQQKLIVLLIKIAQIRTLASLRGGSVFLLDDFMTDFDQYHIDKILPALEGLGIQLIFTSPLGHGYLEQILSQKGAQKSPLS